MKKIFFIAFAVLVSLFQYCSSTRKAQMENQKVTYAARVEPLITNHCSPCHIPPKGNKQALNTYVTAKTNIDEVIARIKKNPEEKGFMPFKHPKLPDSTINVFVQWKADGLLEQ